LLVVLGSMSDSRSFDQVRNSSWPFGGIPAIRAVTVDTSGEAYALTNSSVGLDRMAARYSSTVAATMGSRPATYRGVKARLTRPRSCRCRGGSSQDRLPARKSWNAEPAGSVVAGALEN